MINAAGLRHASFIILHKWDSRHAQRIILEVERHDRAWTHKPTTCQPSASSQCRKAVPT